MNGIKVMWSQPSGGAPVTGYVVHYSNNVTIGTKSEPSSSTGTYISDLFINDTISVEATSQHLSGESENITVTLGRWNDRLTAEYTVADITFRT